MRSYAHRDCYSGHDFHFNFQHAAYHHAYADTDCPTRRRKGRNSWSNDYANATSFGWSTP